MREKEIGKREGRAELKGENKEWLEGDVGRKGENREQKHEISQQAGSMMDRQNDKH